MIMNRDMREILIVVLTMLLPNLIKLVMILVRTLISKLKKPQEKPMRAILKIYRYEHHGFTGNPIYNRLCFFLSQQFKVIRPLNTFIDRDQSRYIDDLNECRPVYEMDLEQSVQIQHQGIAYMISKSYEKESGENKQGRDCYTISCEQAEHLDPLIQEIDRIYRGYFQQRGKVVYQWYTYDEKDHSWDGSAIRTIKTMRNTFLSETNRELVFGNIRKFLNERGRYEQFGIPYKIGYIFYGVPGCGKSSTIYAIAQEFQRNIYQVDLTLGLDELLTAIKSIPSGQIVIFEELDTHSVVHNRKKSKKKGKKPTEKQLAFPLEYSDSGMDCYYQRGLDSLLAILDGYNYFDDTIIIMTTNHIDKIDSAVIRPGRIDHRVEYTYVDRDQLTDIFRVFYPSYQLECPQTLPEMTTSHAINNVILSHLDDPLTATRILFGERSAFLERDVLSF